MRKQTGAIIASVGIALVVFGSTSAVSVTRYRRPAPSVQAQAVQLKNSTGSTPALPWPEYGQSAVGAVGFGLVASHGAQTAAPTASVAKVMTALAVLKQKPLSAGEQGPAITIDADDVASYEYYANNDGSNVRVEQGEQISEYQALQALLLPSANNIAHTLARWAYGSVDAYLTDANGALATQYGLKAAHFTDPSGFDAATVASASDLVNIGLAAMQQPVIAEIVAQTSATIPVAGIVHNFNALLGQNGIVGIKTGNTDQAGGVFLFASKQTGPDKQPLMVVGAVMGAPTLFTAMHDSLGLAAAVPGGFEIRTLVKLGDVVGTYTAPWGAHSSVIAAKDLSATVWKQTASTSKVSLKTITAPLGAQANVGTITMTVNGKDQTANALLTSNLTGPGLRWRLTHK